MTSAPRWLKWFAETFEVLSVTVWLVDETEKRLAPFGSTALSGGNVEDLKSFSRVAEDFIVP